MWTNTELNVYKKLLTVRSHHKAISPDESQIKKINDLITQVDARSARVEFEKQKCKGI